MEDYIINGRIIGAHGIRGELKVVPLTDDARRFLKMKDCYLCGPKLENLTPAKAKSARIDKTNVLLKLEGVEVSFDVTDGYVEVVEELAEPEAVDVTEEPAPEETTEPEGNGEEDPSGDGPEPEPTAENEEKGASYWNW